MINYNRDYEILKSIHSRILKDAIQVTALSFVATTEDSS
jgi:hypothetical protein